jgi:hypothetical protein
MPRTQNTWQLRGEYLAACCGVSAQQFAAGIDSAMAGNRATGATGQLVSASTGAGTKTRRRKRAPAHAAGAAQ